MRRLRSDPADVRFAFEHDRAAARKARRVLDQLFLPTDELWAADVRLAASELINNVIEHTNDGGVMRVWQPKNGLPCVLEVADHDRTSPHMVDPPRPPGQGGSGMRIVDALAVRWGIEHRPDSKIVWAEFRPDH
jgi:hypothetical protein